MEQRENDISSTLLQVKDQNAYCSPASPLDPHTPLNADETLSEIPDPDPATLAPKLRWIVCLSAVLCNVGNYFMLDVQGSYGAGPEHSIESYFHAHGKQYTQSMNQALYSAFTYPGIVTPLIGGILIDKCFGVRTAMVIFFFIVAIGTLVFTTGVCTTSYWVLILGRFIYGLGSGAGSTATSTFLTRWFIHSGLPLASALSISLARIGAVLNFYLCPIITKSISVPAAAWTGTLFCFFSFLTAVTTWLLDAYAVRFGIIKEDPFVLIGRVGPPSSPNSHNGVESHFRISDIFKFPPTLWIITVIVVGCYCAMNSFIGIANDFFQKKFSVSETQSGMYLSLFQLMPVILCPLIGFAVDFSGRLTIWNLSATIVLAFLMLEIILTRWPPYVQTVILGILYSLIASALWPCIAYVLPKNAIASGYGVAYGIQSAGIATTPLICGSILDHYTPKQGTDPHKTPLPSLKGFRIAIGVLLICASISAFLSAVLLFVDLRHDGRLTASAKRRAEILNSISEERKRQSLTNASEDNEQSLVSAKNTP